MMKCIVNVVILSFVLMHGAHAFKANSRAAGTFMGSAQDVQQVQQSDDLTWMALKRFTISWGTVAMGAGIGGLVAGAIVAGAMLVGGKKGDSKEAEDEVVDEKAEPLIQASEETPTDYAQLIKNLGKKVVDDVGPKFEKGGAVRNVLEKRMESFQDKAKNFLLNEMNSAAGAVMREMEAEESMLLIDWNNAVESSMPPASILIAGVLSPTVINLMASHHFVQCVTVGLPLICLCTFAIYTDFAAPCSIPTIFGWLYTQTVLAFLLFVGHLILFFKLASGRKSLQAKMDEVHENMEGTEDGGFANVKEKFIGNTIILQEALMIENGVRHSIWNTVVGLATVAWLITTIWNLVLIAGWTFVPGIVAFHPKAAAVAPDSFCGAWATVLVLRISMLLSVLYLFLNIATVIQWLCDVAIKSSAFSDATLKWARSMDKNSSGMPIVEMLVKAFLLRGGDETIISRLAIVQYHKKSLKNKEAKIADQLAALNGKISGMAKEEEQLNNKVTADGGGDLAAQVQKLNGQSVDYDNWKKQGSSAIDNAEMAAIEMGAASTEALDKLYEKINDIMEEVKNSETVQLAAAKAQEAKEYAEEVKEYAEQQAQLAYDKLNDPEFQQKMRDLAAQASAKCEELGNQAKDLANDAIAAASDPEFQKQLQDAANAAMDQVKAAADQAAAAANDPELQRKLKEAMEQAQAKAMEAAATVTDPELQKKMQENAMLALEEAKKAAESAANAIIDPEMQKQLQEQAMAAVDQASAAAAQAAAAVTDPEIREAALAKLAEAQKAAEMAAAAAQDPEIRKKFEEQAKKALEQAKTIAAETAAAVMSPEMQKKLQDQAMAAVEQASTAAAQAAAAATDPNIRAAAVAKLQEAQKAAEAAAAAAQDPETRKKFEEQAQKAMEQAKTLASETADKAKDVAEKTKEAAKDVASKAKGSKK